MADSKLSAEIAKLSFEDALAELEQIVRRLEGGAGKLDEAIQSYERGALLKRHCTWKRSLVVLARSNGSLLPARRL